MEKITFQCETITPMFLAGADGKTPELRPPSIKAAMRFWWRAMNGHLSLKDLKEKESEIFGGSGENEGRSKFSIRIVENISKTKKDFSGNYIARNPEWYKMSKGKYPIKVNPIEYLGYGVHILNKGWSEYLTPNSAFSVELFVHEKKYSTSLLNSFRFLASFGALGSKSRNGFGQFRISDEPYLSFKELKTQNASSDFSHLSNQLKIFRLKKSHSNWVEVLARLGDLYRYSKLATDGEKYKYDNRKFIAAPVRKDVFKRKSKPYFFNVAKVDEKTYEGFIIYMPFFDLIENKDIYTNGFNPSFNNSLKSACELLNKKLLENDELEEVTL